MLTKDLLKHTVRKGRVYPAFIDKKDAKAYSSADDLLKIFQQHQQACVGELDQALQDLGYTTHKREKAFCKILKDRMLLEEATSLEADRWNVYKKRQILHKQAQGCYATYQKLVEQEFQEDFQIIGARLYADLDENRKIIGQKVTSANELIARYNCAQVQGLLLRAKKVIWTLEGADVAELRHFVRGLRFFRLLLVPLRLEGTFQVEVSGPLSIFQQNQAYGLKLASFLTWGIQAKKWSLEAEIEMKNGMMTLLLDEKSGLLSPHQQNPSWLPDEFGMFIEQFSGVVSDWSVQSGGEFLNLGQEQYCFPDMTFQHATGAKYHFELFHKWHAKNCLARLQYLETCVKNQPILIGVSRDLLKNAEIKQHIETSRYFEKSGMLFRDFPSNRKVLQLLKQNFMAC